MSIISLTSAEVIREFLNLYKETLEAFGVNDRTQSNQVER